MDIAVGMDVDGPLEKTLERAAGLRERGFTRMWSSQIFGPDTLTVFAVVGREYRDLDLGTAVVPIQTRHPTMLAAQARTVQEAIGGRLSLGIGLSHKAVVEGMWGISFDRPARYMSEYLDALAPMLRGERVNVKGERVSATTIGVLGPGDVRTPGLLVAALAPKMLEMAGTLTDGTLTWMTGVQTIATHVVPTINAAAAAAGRPTPRVVCSLPISVTGDVAETKTKVNERLAIYGTLPSYRAMLDREGAEGPADVGLFGTRDQVLDRLHELAEAGVTEFSASMTGEVDDRDETYDTLLEYQSR
ncbi:MAG: TIGR03564 family F420-dependent LLM class oxidoreductase [Acidimicrobiales bacterium]|jgi:F420-dependent oxidoreductase-like protein